MTVSALPLATLSESVQFLQRHISSEEDQQQILQTLGYESIEALLDDTLPNGIRLSRALDLPQGCSEAEALRAIEALANQNKPCKSFIGMGYYNTHTPSVIQRNLFENPGWYTAYTPYQPEISQGRLEMLLNYQQMVIDLTGLPIANASLLDEASAAAEAMALCHRHNGKVSPRYFVADDVHPQTIDVIKTRAQWLGIDVIVGNPTTDLFKQAVFGVQLQYPSSYGDIQDIPALVAQAKAQGVMVAVATDLLALMLLKPPGQFGADVVLGSTQRFGVPMGFGGPHAAFFATTDAVKRLVPGRIIGVSKDRHGSTALRMSMQTREQHIRREKANSNICTAQALLANMAVAYAIYHGAEGLKQIAERVHRLTHILYIGLTEMGFHCNASFFDTLTIQVGSDQQSILLRAMNRGYNLRAVGDTAIGISLDETTTANDLIELFNCIMGEGSPLNVDSIDRQICSGNIQYSGAAAEVGIPQALRRNDRVLSHAVFKQYQTETALMRYLKQLENKDYSLVQGMIPLGSCTMKLNAAVEMQPVSWSAFTNVHPYAPYDQVEGYHALLQDLQQSLLEITGYDAMSLQPNSGALGEYAGLLAIRGYQAAQGEGHRNICLIPASAHGTNPATSAMLGMKVVIVNCDAQGNVDIADLTAKAQQYQDVLSALMITYPSTHGVFEEGINEICRIVHLYGGQVYLDGANMNALVGLSRPGDLGADVSHLNLHKTFAIPHGGGGPGIGPIGVKAHLAPHLPGHCVAADASMTQSAAVTAAPYGSASILPISWMYIKMLGAAGLKQATSVAILNANYIAEQLSAHYKVLYRGKTNRVAHECIIDIRPIKQATGISEEDIAKRLMDYGFHAPTMSFPVVGTLMIEPTESESKAELDRFIAAMIAIKEEIDQVAQGGWPKDDNPLVNAPHTQLDLMSEAWTHSYSREVAAFPAQGQLINKYWPTVNRVDNAYGDRHFCCCYPIE